MKRRRMLAIGASTITSGVVTAGCFEGSLHEPTGSSTKTRTEETPTDKSSETNQTPRESQSSPGSLDQLDLTSKVTNESSEETPAKLQTELTNTGEGPVTFYTGPTLVFRADGNAFKHGVLLYPDEFIGPNETPTESSGDCWRYTDDNYLVQAEAVNRTLGSGQLLTETHSIYTVGEDTPCLPDGEYVFYDEVRNEHESKLMTLAVTLTVKDETIEVTASESME